MDTVNRSDPNALCCITILVDALVVEAMYVSVSDRDQSSSWRQMSHISPVQRCKIALTTDVMAEEIISITNQS
jgi:hypothetical protein